MNLAKFLVIGTLLISSISTQANPTAKVDVNGDGKADIVGFGVDGTIVSLSTGTTFSAPQVWLPWFGNSPATGSWNNDILVPRKLADVNGDGLTDIVGFASYGVQVALSTGSGFSTPQTWLQAFGSDPIAGSFQNQAVHPRMLADVNGDGKADIVGFHELGVWVSVSLGTSFSTPTIWANEYGTHPAGGGWPNTLIAPRILADVNGDGKADIVGFGQLGTVVSLSTGSGFTAPALWLSAYGSHPNTGAWYDNHNTPRMMADMNGDGKADIVGFGYAGVWIALSTGTGFGVPSLWTTGFSGAFGWSNNNLKPRTVADVNGDGKYDIVGFETGGTWVAISTGSGLQAPYLALQAFGTGPTSGDWLYNAIVPRRLVDMSGDGKADIVGFASYGTVVSISNGSSFSSPTLALSSFGQWPVAGDWLSIYLNPRAIGESNEADLMMGTAIYPIPK